MRHGLRRAGLLALLLVGLLGCDLPRDAEGTLDRVRGGTMRVGLSPNPPWVRLAGDQVGGIEPALLREWAAELGARVEWVRGSETALVEAMREGALDVLALGLLEDTPFADQIATSQPYMTTEVRFALPPDRTAPADWRGQAVVVEPERPVLAALAMREGASPAPTQGAAAGFVLYDFEAVGRGLLTSGPRLARERHVLAVRAGESAFLLSLDRFLHARGEAAIRELAAGEAGR